MEFTLHLDVWNLAGGFVLGACVWCCLCVQCLALRATLQGTRSTAERPRAYLLEGGELDLPSSRQLPLPRRVFKRLVAPEQDRAEEQLIRLHASPERDGAEEARLLAWTSPSSSPVRSLAGEYLAGPLPVMRSSMAAQTSPSLEGRSPPPRRWSDGMQLRSAATMH